MELVLIVTFAGLIGGVLRYLIPGRDRHGMITMPALQVAVASVLWTGSVWLGLSPQSPWPWLVALGLSTVFSVALGIYLPKRRDAEDEQLLASLTQPSPKA